MGLISLACYTNERVCCLPTQTLNFLEAVLQNLQTITLFFLLSSQFTVECMYIHSSNEGFGIIAIWAQ